MKHDPFDKRVSEIKISTVENYIGASSTQLSFDALVRLKPYGQKSAFTIPPNGWVEISLMKPDSDVSSLNELSIMEDSRISMASQ